MNLKANISFKFDPKAILAWLLKARTLLIIVAILALAGFTLYQISLITAIGPDDTTLAAEREKVDNARIKFDTTTIQAISRQNQIITSPSLSNIGKTDPFYQ